MWHSLPPTPSSARNWRRRPRSTYELRGSRPARTFNLIPFLNLGGPRGTGEELCVFTALPPVLCLSCRSPYGRDPLMNFAGPGRSYLLIIFITIKRESGRPDSYLTASSRHRPPLPISCLVSSKPVEVGARPFLSPCLRCEGTRGELPRVPPHLLAIHHILPGFGAASWLD